MIDFSLQILSEIQDEIEFNSLATQRDFAKKLNLSLGSVNSALNDLKNRGLISFSNYDNRKILYKLTDFGREAIVDFYRANLKKSLSFFKKTGIESGIELVGVKN